MSDIPPAASAPQAPPAPAPAAPPAPAPVAPVVDPAVAEQLRATLERAAAAERELARVQEAQNQQKAEILKEQGKYRELYETTVAELTATKTAQEENLKRASLERVLSKSGIVDDELAEFIFQKTKDKLTLGQDGKVYGATDIVNLYKTERPHFFRQETPAAPAASAPVVPPVNTNPLVNPPANNAAGGQFNAMDPNVKASDVEAQWQAELQRIRRSSQRQ